MSRAGLARRVMELGGAGRGQPISDELIAKLENEPERAAGVKLEHVLALSYALDVSPTYMIAPIGYAGQPYVIVTGSRRADPRHMRDWLRGEEALLDQDLTNFTLETPIG